MSGWLNAYDFAALLNPYLLARSVAGVTEEATLAVDFSDISKEFGGDEMEGMEMGYDGSRHCTAKGHDFISVSLVGEALADVPFAKTHLKTCRGDRLAEARCRVGHVQFCADPRCKDAATEDVGVLMVESRFDGKSLCLYVVCPDAIPADRRETFAWAVRAAQAYCDRWQIETSFLTVKQELALEKARVRTFRRLENIFAPCMLACVFMIGHVRGSKRFERIVKALSDDAADVALKTHSLLAGIRTLAAKARIRFISGRPRTRGRLLPGQLTLDLRTADGSVYRL